MCYNFIVVTFMLFLMNCNQLYFSTLNKYKDVEINSLNLAIAPLSNVTAIQKQIKSVTHDTLRTTYKIKNDLLRELQYESQRICKFDSVYIGDYLKDPTFSLRRVKGYQDSIAIPNILDSNNFNCAHVDLVLFLEDITLISSYKHKLGRPINLNSPVTVVLSTTAGLMEMEAVEQIKLRCQYALWDLNSCRIIVAGEVNVIHQRLVGNLKYAGRAWHFVGTDLSHNIFSGTPFRDSTIAK